jgi:hypothetical protein
MNNLNLIVHSFTFSMTKLASNREKTPEFLKERNLTGPFCNNSSLQWRDNDKILWELLLYLQLQAPNYPSEISVSGYHISDCTLQKEKKKERKEIEFIFSYVVTSESWCCKTLNLHSVIQSLSTLRHYFEWHQIIYWQSKYAATLWELLVIQEALCWEPVSFRRVWVCYVPDVR